MTINLQDAYVGALVADAATMGLHWMYDQEQIKKISATGDVLFRQPDATVYEGQKAYFAHAAKKVGEQSQYGESLRLVHRLMLSEGSYSVAVHQQCFFQTFGPCGSYHGFADRPTKALVARMISDGDALPSASGSDDDQLPALCSIPALFSNGAQSDEVAAAVSVTATHEQAITGAQVLFDCLTRLQSGANLPDALEQSILLADTELANLMAESMALTTYDPLGTAEHFGQACHMVQGLPLAWHLLLNADDFESVLRDNVRCGGDSCGRAMAVGSIAGLAFGGPEHLQAKVAYL